MTKETAEFLLEACGDAGVEAELYEDYSGRGMYGAKTTGIVVSSVADVLDAVLEYIGNNVDGDEWLGTKLPATEVHGLRWDGMGTDVIIY